MQKKFLLMEGLSEFMLQKIRLKNPSVKRILNFEKKFLTKKRFKEFKKNVVLSKVYLYSLLKKLSYENKIIFGVGAPSRAATLVNYVGLNEDILKYILEILLFRCF